MDITLDDYLAHYGTPRHSGRYPWGSGEDPQHNKNFLAYVKDLQKQGMSDADIAKGVGLKNSTDLRAAKSIARNAQRQADQDMAQRLKDKGLSTVAIGQRMGKNESTVRSLLDPAAQRSASELRTTAQFLKDQIEEKKYLDVGAGTQLYTGVSEQKLRTAISMLQQEEGYQLHYLKVPQLSGSKETKMKVLTKGDVPYTEVSRNRDKIRTIQGYSEDNGESYRLIEPPKNIDSKRVAVAYHSPKDGVIELRRNVQDISLGAARYAQVRVAVDGTHYLKGMAMYADDLPQGIDIRFNTNKSDTGNKLEAMKAIKDDKESPFGAIVRQKHYIDEHGKEQLSAMNIVGTEDPEGKKTPGEEGGWSQWSKNLSSQFLSKQSPALAKQQLGLALKQRQQEYDEINTLTNPTVKKKLLQAFSDAADSSAVHLKAASIPRQGTHVILPITSMKETEIFAPNFHDGEQVVLVRYPHGGVFEIPQLTVNNKQKEANRLIPQASDAVGIHPKVAERLSGADFDGDTVIVIPNANRQITNAPPLEGLKGFDPKSAYPAYEGMKPMNAKTKQLKMGDVSNLITDMTVKGAPFEDIQRAVRHSMVVIDAEKHDLNWKQSAIDNGIADLKRKYQNNARAGASTLISRASSKINIRERRAARVGEGGPIDIATGEKRYAPTGRSYVIPAHDKINKRTGKITHVPESVKYNEQKTTRMAEASDARQLITGPGTVMEHIYASHANALKSLGNQARKNMVTTKEIPYSASARKVYRPQVQSLQAKLNIALKNAPLERQAILLANANVAARRASNPDMEPGQLKKLKGQALQQARLRVGAGKKRIDISPEEWDAIQAGAVTKNVLNQILDNTDIDRVKALATPRATIEMTKTKTDRARAMLANGYSQSDIAQQLGVSTSTLYRSLKEDSGG